MLTTSISLMNKIRTGESLGWSQFCQLYGPIIYSRCRRAGLQDADASELTQEVFRIVYLKIGQFQQGHPGAKFRGWLGAIIQNQIRAHFRKTAQHRETDGEVNDLPDPRELILEDDEPRETHELLRRALILIRSDYNEHTWKVFERISQSDQSCQDVGKEFGMTANAVRQVKYRVLTRLREELNGLI
jgi:RNA polymerase sigma-70 factor, ECF subfamily